VANLLVKTPEDGHNLSPMNKSYLTLFALLLPLAVWAEVKHPPNVVLFLVDDMGWMDSTPYGSQYYETPNMKRLERQSMRFTNAYATPLCSPTRASILSGHSRETQHRPARREQGRKTHA
jgi:hypothetical protein